MTSGRAARSTRRKKAAVFLLERQWRCANKRGGRRVVGELFFWRHPFSSRGDFAMRSRRVREKVSDELELPSKGKRILRRLPRGLSLKTGDFEGTSRHLLLCLLLSPSLLTPSLFPPPPPNSTLLQTPIMPALALRTLAKVRSFSPLCSIEKDPRTDKEVWQQQAASLLDDRELVFVSSASLASSSPSFFFSTVQPAPFLTPFPEDATFLSH